MPTIPSMKTGPILLRSALALAFAWFAVTPSRAADAKANLTAAIQKLADEPNYSWSSAAKNEGTESNRKPPAVDGKTEKAGITYLKSNAGETSYEVAFKGEKIAVKLAEDWIEPSELPVDASRLETRLRAFKTPTKEATELLGKATDLKEEQDGAYSAKLPPDAAKAVFATLGRRAAEAAEAAGNLKFWVRDGRLAKYEIKVQGKITVGTDKREVNISRTTTVEVKDVGTTKINLPDSAKSRLS